MRSTSSPAGNPREPAQEKSASVLDDLLCIDGVTDLAVYRALTGRGADLVDVPPPPRPRTPQPGEQLGFLFLLPSGGDA